MSSQPAQKMPSSSELLPSEKTVDDKPPAQNPHRGADAKDATAAPIKEERKSRSRSPRPPQRKDSDATTLVLGSSCYIDSDDDDFKTPSKE